jgi:hypothetical protein
MMRRTLSVFALIVLISAAGSLQAQEPDNLGQFIHQALHFRAAQKLFHSVDLKIRS